MGMQYSLYNVQKYIKFVKNEHCYSLKSISKKFNASAAFWLQKGI